MGDNHGGSRRITAQERHEAFWQARKKKFFLVVPILALMLWLLFLCNMLYLYGSVWRSETRYHNFQVLFVDYDQDIIGRSAWEAYQKLKGPGCFTLVPANASQYPSLSQVVDTVKSAEYWGAFVPNENASARLTLALQSEEAAQSYDPADALTYVWNQARYPAFATGGLLANFESLIAATRLAYNSLNGTGGLALINPNTSEPLQVLLNPVEATEINLMPTDQATRIVYNSVSMVMPILQQFFFCLVLNGISMQLQAYSHLPIHISGLVRAALSVVYDLVASLCMTGYIWAYRESWPVSGTQFVLTWMTLWLLMHVHFLIVDAATAFLPLPAIPFFILTYVILNITSSITPFTISPDFYKWGYALPANNAYTVLTDVWSGGAVPRLYRCLPILFSWWVVGIVLASWGHVHRCRKALKQYEAAKKHGKETLPEKGQEDDDNDPDTLERTPSEVLLDAANTYRMIYGPSVPPPMGLWHLFAMSESSHKGGLRRRITRSGRTKEDIHRLDTQDSQNNAPRAAHVATMDSEAAREEIEPQETQEYRSR